MHQLGVLSAVICVNILGLALRTFFVEVYMSTFFKGVPVGEIDQNVEHINGDKTSKK